MQKLSKSITHGTGPRRQRPGAVPGVGGQHRRGGPVTEKAVDNAGARGLIKNVHRGVNLAADQERHLARMVLDPLHERVQPIQPGVASHSHDVRPQELAIESEFPREERTEAGDHEAAGRDAQHVVDVRRGQGHGVQCVADRARPDLECPVPELGVEVGGGLGEQPPGAAVFRREDRDASWRCAAHGEASARPCSPGRGASRSLPANRRWPEMRSRRKRLPLPFAEDCRGMKRTNLEALKFADILIPNHVYVCPHRSARPGPWFRNRLQARRPHWLTGVADEDHVII